MYDHLYKMKSSYAIWLYFIFLSAILIPDFNPTLSDDVDGALAYFINYAFYENRDLIQHMVFPHGPLGWLLYPMVYNVNIVIAAIFVFFSNLLYLVTGYKISQHESNKPKVSLAILSLTLVFIDTQLTLIGIAVFLIIDYFQKPSKRTLLFLFGVLLVTLFIKAYGFIIVASLLIPLLVFIVWKDVDKRKSVTILIMSFFIVFFLIRLIIFGHFDGSLDHLFGIVGLSGNNSGAVSLYVDNNWWLLGIFILSSLAFFGVIFRKYNPTLLLVLSASVFLQWKYSMARQDLLHSKMLILHLLIVYYGMSHYYKFKLVHHSTIILAIGMYFSNHVSLFGETGIKIKSSLLTGKIFSNSSNNVEVKNDLLAQNFMLAPSTLKLIGESTVELYPNQFLYMTNKQVNWTSRPVVQSYAAYSSDLDQYNLEYFQGLSAPEFIIWHFTRQNESESNGDLFESIDRRRVFNNEPKTIEYLLTNYEIIEKSQNYLTLQSRAESELEKRTDNYTSGEMNSWIEIPDKKYEWLDLNIDLSLVGKIQSFFYKSGALYLALETQNGHRQTNRIIPSNAVDGILLSTNELVSSCFDPVVRFKIWHDPDFKYEKSFTFRYRESRINSKNIVSLYGEDDCEKHNLQLSSELLDSEISIEGEYFDLYNGEIDEETMTISCKFDISINSNAPLFLVCQIENNGIKNHEELIQLNPQILSKGLFQPLAVSFKISDGVVAPKSTSKVFIWNPQLSSYHLKHAQTFKDINELKIVPVDTY